MPARRKVSFYRGNSSGDQSIHSLQEVFEQLDVHALKFFFLTRSLSLRIIWMLLFFAGWFAAGYYIRQICVEFGNHRTATKITTKIQEEYDYPPIYICPRYNWDLAKADQQNLSRDAVILAAALGQKNHSHHPLPPIQVETFIADHRLHEFVRSNPEIKKPTYADFYKWMALDSRAIIQEATGLNSTHFSSVFVASPNHDNKPVNYRACYNVSAGKYNPHFGDVFYLQYNIEKPTDGVLGSENDFAFIKDDHRVVLEKDRIYLRKNRFTTIRLSVKEYSRRETKESKCRKNEEVSQQYSQEYCRYQCFADAVDKCSRCKLIFENTDMVGSSLLCTWATKSNLTTECEENSHENYKKCLSDCVPMCEYKTYDFSVAAVVLNNSFPFDTRIGLWIYFLVDDGILVYEEIPIYNVQTLISNIGGQMGLWTGASILTAIELVYLLAQCCCAGWDCKKEPRRADSLSQAEEQRPLDENGAKKAEYEPAPTTDTESDDAGKNKAPLFDGDLEHADSENEGNGEQQESPLHVPKPLKKSHNLEVQAASGDRVEEKAEL